MIKRMRSNDISIDEFVENIYEYERGESTMSNLYEFNGKLPILVAIVLLRLLHSM